MILKRLTFDGPEQVEILPVHILKLRWLEHRRIFLSYQYREIVDDLKSEMIPDIRGRRLTSPDNLRVLNEIYELAREFKRNFRL